MKHIQHVEIGGTTFGAMAGVMLIGIAKGFPAGMMFWVFLILYGWRGWLMEQVAKACGGCAAKRSV